MPQCPCNRTVPTFSHLLKGFVVLGAGVLLLSFNMGWLPLQYKSVVFSWPSAITLVGLILFVQRARFLGAIIAAIGVYLLLHRVGIPVNAVKQIVLPSLLILLGVAMLLRNRNHALPLPNTRKQRNGFIEEHNVFGGSRQQFRDEVFRGGSIYCLFGGSELDLTRTSLPEGTSILDVRCIFGGITLTVPTSWNIQLQTQSLFGGFVEEEHPPRHIDDNGRVLLIQGSCIIGGGEIRYRDPD